MQGEGEGSADRRRSVRKAPRLGRMKGDVSGSTLVEFAIIAPVFFFLLFVIAEMAMLFVTETVMDHAVSEAARQVRTGQVQQAQTSAADFKREVCEGMSVFVDCAGSDFYLDVKAYESFAEMQLGSPLDESESYGDEGDYAFGGPGDIVVVRAYYQWKTNPIYGSLSLANMSNGRRLLGSFAAFRNEPFPEPGVN